MQVNFLDVEIMKIQLRRGETDHCNRLQPHIIISNSGVYDTHPVRVIVSRQSIGL